MVDIDGKSLKSEIRYELEQEFKNELHTGADLKVRKQSFNEARQHSKQVNWNVVEQKQHQKQKGINQAETGSKAKSDNKASNVNENESKAKAKAKDKAEAMDETVNKCGKCEDEQKPVIDYFKKENSLKFDIDTKTTNIFK